MPPCPSPKAKTNSKTRNFLLASEAMSTSTEQVLAVTCHQVLARSLVDHPQLFLLSSAADIQAFSITLSLSRDAKIAFKAQMDGCCVQVLLQMTVLRNLEAW